MSNNMKMQEVLIPKNKVSCLGMEATLKEALDGMTETSHGICVFLNQSNQILGLLTDGDLRRLILTQQQPLPSLLVSPAISFGTTKPLVLKVSASLDEALSLMDSRNIWYLPIVDLQNFFVGLLSRHTAV